MQGHYFEVDKAKYPVKSSLNTKKTSPGTFKTALICSECACVSCNDYNVKIVKTIVLVTLLYCCFIQNTVI